LIIAAVGGAVSGGFAATGIGALGQAGINAAIGGVSEAINQFTTKGKKVYLL